MIKPLKNNKGMTLIELIVGMLMFTIISASVTAVLAPYMRLYFKANDLAETNTLLDNLSSEILGDLWSATGVEITDTPDTSLTIRTDMSTVVYNVSAGLLCKNSTPVLDGRYYKDKTVKVEYYGADDYDDDDADEIRGAVNGAFVVRVLIISQDGSVMANRDYAVNPLGLNRG